MSLFMTSINKLTTKTRTVFDTSAKNGDEKSLNECLYSGLLLKQNCSVFYSGLELLIWQLFVIFKRCFCKLK